MRCLSRHAGEPVFRIAAYTVFVNPSSNRLNDNLTEFADLRAAHPTIPDFAWRIVLGYTPKSSITTAWPAVRSFTVACTTAMEPDTFDKARRAMTVIANFHMWVWTRGGTTLTVPAIYTQSNIDRFLETAHKANSSTHRWGVSRQLVKIGRELGDADLHTIPLTPGKRRAPFSAKQIATMHSWANSLNTVLKRRNAWALLGLAGGAGLTAAEIMNVRGTDVDQEGDVVSVNVTGAQARRVPVRAAWARVLLRSLEGREGSDELLFRGPRIEEYPPRALQTFLTDHPAPVRPTPSLLRAAWILHHINNDVPPLVLMHVSGIDNFQTLSRYYAHAAAPDIDAYTTLLVTSAVAR